MRAVSSSMEASRSARVSGGRLSQASRSVPAAPRMPVRGVRRSWLREFSSAVRSRCVSSMAAVRADWPARRTRSRAMAAWSARASRACSSGGSKPPDAAARTPMTPAVPRTVRIGRKRQVADGRVAVPRPASTPCAAAQRAAARAPSSRVSRAGSVADRRSSSPSIASTAPCPAMPAACLAISAINSGSAAGSPRRRLNAPTRRRLSMRAWPARASARTRPASRPVMAATTRNTAAATASCVLAMVMVWMGGMKKKSHAKKATTAV